MKTQTPTRFLPCLQQCSGVSGARHKSYFCPCVDDEWSTNRLPPISAERRLSTSNEDQVKSGETLLLTPSIFLETRLLCSVYCLHTTDASE